MKKYHVALVGATGLVGRTMLKVLEESHFPLASLRLLASSRSAGQKIRFQGQDWTVQDLAKMDWEGIDLAFFSAGASVSGDYAPQAAQKGVLVVDNSSRWRQDPDIPLVVPEVNSQVLKGYRGIIANPNCSTIQCMAILKVLRDLYGLRRIVYSTYQAASGAGMKGLRDLEENTTETFDHPLQKNVLPRIDAFLPNGYTKEEWKMVEESRKILDLPHLAVTATAVRVPVDYGHSVAIDAELEKDFDLDQVRQALAAEESLVVKDDPAHLLYPIPDDVKGQDKIFVGRIRRDLSQDKTIQLWCVADNIRKGAATNSIQIAEAWIRLQEA